MEHNEIEAALRLRISDLEREAGTWQLLAQTKMTEMIQQAALKAIANAEIVRLKAEVERLRKAGDALAEAFDLKYPVAGGLINAWNAAKDGKPTE